MILEEETHKRFGYYPKDLKPHSHKKVLAKCDGCGKIRILPKRDSFALCLSCARKGKRNMMFGKHHSEEVRKKISQNRIYIEGKNHPNWKPKIKCICLECGKEFEVKPSVTNNGFGKYCSVSCQNVAYSKRYKGKNNPSWGGGPVKCKCKECGKEFETKRSEIKKGWGIFCSKNCMFIFQRGEHSPGWKGGISFEPYCYKFNEQFKQYIRVKFGNVCFLCGKTEEENGQRLSVHHCNYNKECGCAETEQDRKTDDNECQFVPLCRSCNAKVNKDRDKWERYFKNKLRNKLNGWYI